MTATAVGTVRMGVTNMQTRDTFPELASNRTGAKPSHPRYAFPKVDKPEYAGDKKDAHGGRKGRRSGNHSK